MPHHNDKSVFDIRLQRLYYQDRTLLEEVHLQVAVGDKILINGKTGSGKTSLLHCLNLMNPSFDGEIHYRGLDIRQISPEHLRRQVMEVMQEPWLDSGNVLDALREPWSYRIHQQSRQDFYITAGWRKRIAELLEMLGLDEAILKASTCELSGGEKQRIAFVRVMQFEPPVMLLDEVSSALDQSTSEVIAQCLHQHWSNTIIAISHDPVWKKLWQHRWDLSDQKVRS